MRDKTLDDRFFILTLFGIAMEAEKRLVNQGNTFLSIDLPVGLPPKHYGALHKKFQEYFMGRGKAQYLVKAVLAYQSLQENGQIALVAGGSIEWDNGFFNVISRTMKRKEVIDIV